jgi:hypothetical protein
MTAAVRHTHACRWWSILRHRRVRYTSSNAHEVRIPFDYDTLTVTIRPMEVRTFIVHFK